ncbi:type I restriction-modification enzyme S subunit [Moraxella macacae 0408225]|uniref:Type I restriction-modification enzyme S subunit n=1 Tax=Moraxella macacae 0408225 TaxID=1230338 RepID=L2F6U3_9GAMM|nr:type I restriction-modification enzyme S subunit [Moraxella macacae 0408225]
MIGFIERLLNGREVAWKSLGDIIHSIKTGLNPRNFFQLNTNDADNYYITIRELQNHEIVFTDKTDKINDEALKLCNNRSNLEKGDVLFSGTGTIGTVALVKETPKNWNIKEGVYAIKPIQSEIIPSFLLYLFETDFIRNDFLSKSAGGTVKSVPMKEMAKIKIPIPPLDVQNEIVRILDKFTALNSELIKELDLRKKQYDYYRDKLLTFGDEVAWKTLDEIFAIFAGGDVPKNAFSKIQTNEFNIPILSNGIGEKSLYGWTNIAKINQPSLTISARGTIGWTSYQENPFFPIVRLLVLTPKIELNIKFAYHFMKLIENDYKIPKSGIPQLTKPMIKDLKFPIPLISEQKRIADILDKFETLTNSITEGLPKEIQLRTKQYEYYREQLLTFDKSFDK